MVQAVPGVTLTDLKAELVSAVKNLRTQIELSPYLHFISPPEDFSLNKWQTYSCERFTLHLFSRDKSRVIFVR